MFFEPQHSISENLFTLREMMNLKFPLHFHHSFEYVEQLCGSTEIVIDQRRYLLKEGDAVLIFPLQPHSYATVERGRVRVCIFAPSFVTEFYKSHETKFPTDNKFRCPLPQPIRVDNVYHKKALTYFMCGEFDKDREYAEVSKKNENRIFVNLLLFLNRNFCNSCLLRDAAAEIGYDYAYISKLFKRKVGIPFRQYVNNLRIIESKRLLKDDTKSIEEIAQLCGFSSLRTFDREFLKQTGVSPLKYRKGFPFNLHNDADHG